MYPINPTQRHSPISTTLIRGYGILINSNSVILKNKLTRMTAQKSLSISFFTLFFPFYLGKLILFIRTRGRVALTVWLLSLGV